MSRFNCTIIIIISNNSLIDFYLLKTHPTFVGSQQATTSPILSTYMERTILTKIFFILCYMYREECFPIVIPQPGDPYFPPAITCMNFVRSTPAISSGCIPGKSETTVKV